MESCEKVLKQLCDELAEDVHSELCNELKKHLQECEDCRRQMQAMRNVVDLFRCLKEQDVPTDVHRRLLKLLNVEEAL